MYFFGTGARTPLLALLALRRPRNLAALVVPYVVLGVGAMFVGDRALILLALAPAPLVAPSLARFVGAREETAGALAAGTVVVSFLLTMAAVPGIGVNANMVLFAFVVGAALAGSLPTVRDQVLPILDGARYLAIAFLLGAAVVASVPLFGPTDLAPALAILLLGAGSGALAAKALGGSALAGAIGGGTRDSAIAAGFALSAGLVGAGSLAVAYAIVLGLGLVLGKLVARQT